MKSTLLLCFNILACCGNIFNSQDTTVWPFDNNDKVETSDEFFERLDTNNDTLLDFNDYLQRNSYFVELSRREFQKLDQNHDGNVTRSELHDYNQRLKAEQKVGQLAASNITFSIFDDGDQKWTVDEFKTYVRNYLHRRTENADKIFIQFDLNNDSKLDLEEFSRLDFAFPWEQFPVNFDIPQPILIQSTATQSSTSQTSIMPSKNKTQ